MLQNAIASFLANASERELDLPLLTLLPALGYFDVHLVHGQSEFGKDIIAKRKQSKLVTQYIFQAKVGDITQAKLRNEVLGQLLEGLTTDLAHPNFDPKLDRVMVLVTTGDLTGNARIGFQSFQKDTVSKLKNRELVFWGGGQLLSHFMNVSETSLVGALPPGEVSSAAFLSIFGRFGLGFASGREWEDYSQNWASHQPLSSSRLLRATVETAIIGNLLTMQQRNYDAFLVNLSLLRLLTYQLSLSTSSDLSLMFTAALRHTSAHCEDYVHLISSHWQEAGDLVSMIRPLDIASYPVACARIAEMTSFLILTGEEAEPSLVSLGEFLNAFISTEPGSSHPISDRYAVSVVVAVLAMIRSDNVASASDYIRRTTIWLCDNYENDLGLAGIESDEVTEIRYLLGNSLDFVDIERNSQSLIVTALCDLSAFLNDSHLYKSVVNDILSCHIVPIYHQPSNSSGACILSGNDTVYYPNISFSDTLPVDGDRAYGNHFGGEPRKFDFCEATGMPSLVILMILLRDRYFVASWPQLLEFQPSDVNR